MSLRGVLSFLLLNIPMHCILNTPLPVYKSSLVIKRLWQLPLDKFNFAFQQIIAQYESDQEKLLNPLYCSKFTHHCSLLHNFLKHLYIEPGKNTLWYIRHEESGLGKIALISYWQMHRFESFFCFFALYYDCLAKLFVIELNQAWHQAKTDEYSEYRLKAERNHSEMSALCQYLIGSSFEERYTKQHARYHDLLAFVQIEKDKLIHE